MSAAQAGRTLTLEHKRKISAALMGRRFSAEARRKMSMAATGRRHSVETQRKMRASHASRDRILWLDSKGYVRAKLISGSYWKYIHRLAYVYYFGPIPTGLIVHHRNGDKLDNSRKNLEAMTRGEHAVLHRKK